MLISLAFVSAASGQGKPVRFMQVPGADAYCRIDTSGVSVIPSGRYIAPAGKTMRIA
ncbi:MAG: hypothetical protein RL181_2949, partial [Bacteroidota bacterium]